MCTTPAFTSPSQRSGTALFPIPLTTDTSGATRSTSWMDIQPAARIVNLETSVTTSDDFWPLKGIHYRMHPGNVELLKAAGINCCVLSNNHVIDLGFRGLLETLKTLRRAGIKTAGAGETASEAASPAILEIMPGIRVAVFGYGMESAGVPESWAARGESPGVNFIPDLSPQAAAEVIESIKRQSRPEDIVIFSVHWGGNWGYSVPEEQINFAHRLLDSGAVDAVHGHSSHHVRPLEVYRGKLIVYGAGDFLNDYEGITGARRLPRRPHTHVLPDVRLKDRLLDPASDGSASDFPVQPATGFSG